MPTKDYGMTALPTPATTPLALNGRVDSAALQKAILLLAAVALNALELAIPRIPFLPWLKPGFANIITVLWIVRYGLKDALLYTALRIWISGFYFGFSLFTVSLSFSGGMLATVAMGAAWVALGRRGAVGAVGMAVIGALFHNAGQLAVVYFLMARNMGVLGQVPFMLLAAVLFGGMTGGLVPVVGRILGGGAQGSKMFDPYVGVDSGINGINTGVSGIDTNASGINTNINTRINGINTDANGTNTRINKTTSVSKLIVTLTFAVSISLMFVSNRYVLIAAAVTFSIASLLLTKKPFALVYPIRFYMLFLFIALTSLLFSYGTRIDIIPFITHESLSAFATQSLRLWCWLQTVHIFKRFGFHEMFISALRRVFPNNGETLEAGMIALEHFPEVVRFAKSSKSSKKVKLTALLFHPQAVLAEYVGRVADRLAVILRR